MSFKIIILPPSKLLVGVQISLFLTCFAFPSCNAQGLWDNGTYNRNEHLQRFHITNLAVIGFAIGLSFMITLALAICRNRRLLCGSGDPTQQNHSTNLPPNHNFHDVILSFAGPGGQMMPMPMPTSTMFAPFYQQDLSPPPPYHLAIHYPPLQPPAYKKDEANSDSSAESQNPDSNLSESTTVSTSTPTSASATRTTTTNSGIINPSFDENV